MPDPRRVIMPAELRRRVDRITGVLMDPDSTPEFKVAALALQVQVLARDIGMDDAADRLARAYDDGPRR